MEEIHELLGIAALAVVLFTSALGMVIYRWVWFKDLLGSRRKLLLLVHFSTAAFFVALLIPHYLTTEKSNIFLLSGSAFLLAVFLLGLSLRYSKRYYRPTVRLKIVLLLICIPVLLSGHGLADEEEEEEYRISRQERIGPSAVMRLPEFHGQTRVRTIPP